MNEVVSLLLWGVWIKYSRKLLHVWWPYLKRLLRSFMLFNESETNFSHTYLDEISQFFVGLNFETYLVNGWRLMDSIKHLINSPNICYVKNFFPNPQFEGIRNSLSLIALVDVKSAARNILIVGLRGVLYAAAIVIEGLDTSETSNSYWRKLENPRKSLKNPAETHRMLIISQWST